jgi:hypothetical protein
MKNDSSRFRTRKSLLATISFFHSGAGVMNMTLFPPPFRVDAEAPHYRMRKRRKETVNYINKNIK